VLPHFMCVLSLLESTTLKCFFSRIENTGWSSLQFSLPAVNVGDWQSVFVSALARICAAVSGLLQPWNWRQYVSEMLSTHKSTWCYYPEDQLQHLHWRENLGSSVFAYGFIVWLIVGLKNYETPLSGLLCIFLLFRNVWCE
jgi:hypothetical protein